MSSERHADVAASILQERGLPTEFVELFRQAARDGDNETLRRIWVRRDTQPLPTARKGNLDDLRPVYTGGIFPMPPGERPSNGGELLDGAAFFKRVVDREEVLATYGPEGVEALGRGGSSREEII